MKYKLVYLLLAISVIVVYFAHLDGLFGMFIWNLVPIIVVFVLTYNSHKKGAGVTRPLSFYFGSFLIWGWLHIEWIFNIGDIKTSDALIYVMFLTIPVFSSILGTVSLLLVNWHISRKEN
jgi:hypothetical protein